MSLSISGGFICFSWLLRACFLSLAQCKLRQCLANHRAGYFRVRSDYAQPITGQVTEVTCLVIGWAQPELTPSKRQKTGPGHWTAHWSALSIHGFVSAYCSSHWAANSSQSKSAVLLQEDGRGRWLYPEGKMVPGEIPGGRYVVVVVTHRGREKWLTF